MHVSRALYLPCSATNTWPTPLESSLCGVNFAQGRMQDVREEQRAKRRRLLSAAASARIRRGMIRYLTV